MLSCSVYSTYSKRQNHVEKDVRIITVPLQHTQQCMLQDQVHMSELPMLCIQFSVPYAMLPKFACASMPVFVYFVLNDHSFFKDLRMQMQLVAPQYPVVPKAIYSLHC